MQLWTSVARMFAMQTINCKGITEAIGIAAIVASLKFVGMHMRQSQEIDIAETYMSILSGEIAASNIPDWAVSAGVGPWWLCA
jgi:hypothetical protein